MEEFINHWLTVRYRNSCVVCLQVQGQIQTNLKKLFECLDWVVVMLKVNQLARQIDGYFIYPQGNLGVATVSSDHYSFTLVQSWGICLCAVGIFYNYNQHYMLLIKLPFQIRWDTLQRVDSMSHVEGTSIMTQARVKQFNKSNHPTENHFWKFTDFQSFVRKESSYSLKQVSSNLCYCNPPQVEMCLLLSLLMVIPPPPQEVLLHW